MLLLGNVLCCQLRWISSCLNEFKFPPTDFVCVFCVQTVDSDILE
jgi:hypothetical protein